MFTPHRSDRLRISPVFILQAGFIAALVIAPPAVCAAEGAGEPTPARQRLVSPHVAQMLTDVAARQPMPATAPVDAESAARPPAQTEERDVPANGIVRLPAYLVRDSKLPSREEVMSRRAIEEM